MGKVINLNYKPLTAIQANAKYLMLYSTCFCLKLISVLEMWAVMLLAAGWQRVQMRKLHSHERQL